VKSATLEFAVMLANVCHSSTGLAVVTSAMSPACAQPSLLLRKRVQRPSEIPPQPRPNSYLNTLLVILRGSSSDQTSAASPATLPKKRENFSLRCCSLSSTVASAIDVLRANYTHNDDLLHGLKFYILPQQIVPKYNLNASACKKFIELTKEDPSREWDLTSTVALCPDDSSFKDSTSEFLLQVAAFIKSPSALAEDVGHVGAALREALTGGLEGMMDAALKAALFGGLGGFADKKEKSKYQFK
jgi:hypothetical protein